MMSPMSVALELMDLEAVAKTPPTTLPKVNSRTTKPSTQSIARTVFDLELLPISRLQAATFIQQHHYARKLPSTCKLYLGGFRREGLMAVGVWGYGVRPLHTARKLMLGAVTAEYLELNRFCVHDSMPRNSESHFLSLCMEWIEQNMPQVEWLLSFADGIYGKPGYVYQAAGWLYVGKFLTERYILPDGTVIHPRLPVTRNGTRAWTFMESHYPGVRHLWGHQFKYLKLIGSSTDKRHLLKRLLVSPQPYPKHDDCLIYEAVEGSKVSCRVSFTEGQVRFLPTAP